MLIYLNSSQLITRTRTQLSLPITLNICLRLVGGKKPSGHVHKILEMLAKPKLPMSPSLKPTQSYIPKTSIEHKEHGYLNMSTSATKEVKITHNAPNRETVIHKYTIKVNNNEIIPNEQQIQIHQRLKASCVFDINNDKETVLKPESFIISETPTSIPIPPSLSDYIAPLNIRNSTDTFNIAFEQAFKERNTVLAQSRIEKAIKTLEETTEKKRNMFEKKGYEETRAIFKDLKERYIKESSTEGWADAKKTYFIELSLILKEYKDFYFKEISDSLAVARDFVEYSTIITRTNSIEYFTRF